MMMYSIILWDIMERCIDVHARIKVIIGEISSIKFSLWKSGLRYPMI